MGDAYTGPMVDPRFYEEIRTQEREQDRVALRQTVEQIAPGLDTAHPDLAGVWPTLEEAHAQALAAHLEAGEREQFIAGFGFGAVAAVVAMWLVTRGSRKDNPYGYDEGPW